MLKTIRFPLSNYPRPIITATLNNNLTRCLIDTGADIPVWVDLEETFVRKFPDAVLVNESCMISGFGGEGVPYRVYRIPVLYLCDANGIGFSINNCIVAVGQMTRLNVQMILSANMLKKIDYSILNSAGEVVFTNVRDEYYMTLIEDGKSVTVFEQRETLKDMFSNATGNK